jgi:tRNA(Leu) C34 or U34 (ribose-2'-O)-methylase TrmL
VLARLVRAAFVATTSTTRSTAHLTPAQHDHINFYGTYSFTIDAELRREGHRSLRIPAQPPTRSRKQPGSFAG